MRLIYATFLFVNMQLNANAQLISDNQFSWVKFEGCQPLINPYEVYLKVEKDPILLELSKAVFIDFLDKSIAEINIADNIDGVIKLKILFPLNAPLCVLELGEMNMALTGIQIEILRQKIMTIKDIGYGRQKGVEKNCQGILYIEVSNGRFSKMRNVNFGFGK